MTDGLIQVERAALEEFLEICGWLDDIREGYMEQFLGGAPNEEYLQAGKEFDRLYFKFSQLFKDNQEAIEKDGPQRIQSIGFQ